MMLIPSYNISDPQLIVDDSGAGLSFACAFVFDTEHAALDSHARLCKEDFAAQVRRVGTRGSLV